MPNNKNAKKALRKSEKARLRNRANRATLRTLVKRLQTAAAGTDAEATETAFRAIVKRLDQAAAKSLIHKNKASRLKSRLSRLVKKPQATA